MARVNRYSTPAQDRYFNTYIPLPYEQLMTTVAGRQAQLSKEQDQLNKTYEDTKNLRYIPGTQDEKYVRDYLGKVDNLVQNYISADLTDPIVKQKMMSQFSNITNRQDIQNVQDSWGNWMANNKYKSELKSQGLYDPSIDEDPASDPNFSTIGGSVYNYTTSPYKNPRPSAETYFNNLDNTYLGEDNTFMWSGVWDKEIASVAEAKWNEFSNTSEGNLYIKKIAKEQGLDYNDPAERKRIATEYLIGVGQEFKRRNPSGPSTSASKRGGSGEQDIPTVPTPTVDTPGESLLGNNKKWTGARVINEQKNLEGQINEIQGSIDDIAKINPDDYRLNQLALQLSLLTDKKQIIDNNIETATSYWDDQLKARYEEVENKFRTQALKHGLSPEAIKEQFKDHDFIEKEVGSLSGIPMYIQNYYSRILGLNKLKEDKIKEHIDEFGIKSVSGKRILPLPIKVDVSNNAYYVVNDKSHYASSSSLVRDIKEKPEGYNIIQESASSKSNNKDKNKEIEDLRKDIRNATELKPSAYSPMRNSDGSLDVMFQTTYTNKTTSTNVPSRNLRVRITDESQIRSIAQDLENTGNKISSDIILDPELAETININKPRKSGGTYTVIPAEGWYPYTIKKVDNGWDILDSNGNKIKSGNKELPTFPMIEDVIHYMYQVREFVYKQATER